MDTVDVPSRYKVLVFLYPSGPNRPAKKRRRSCPADRRSESGWEVPTDLYPDRRSDATHPQYSPRKGDLVRACPPDQLRLRGPETGFWEIKREHSKVDRETMSTNK
jgi:hypothetical protein